jgi:hypothetical protein
MPLHEVSLQQASATRSHRTAQTAAALLRRLARSGRRQVTRQPQKTTLSAEPLLELTTGSRAPY